MQLIMLLQILVQRLPPQFVKNHVKNLSEKAKLRAESGDSWIVRTERIGDHLFFTDGWMKFAQDADLKFREFLLFKFVGNSTFEVSVYGISGCLKELHSCPRTHEQDDHYTQGSIFILSTLHFSFSTFQCAYFLNIT